MNHLARTAYYRDIVLPLVTKAPDTMPETTMQPRIMDNWTRYGTFVFGAPGDPPCLVHADAAMRGHGELVLEIARWVRRVAASKHVESRSAVCVYKPLGETSLSTKFGKFATLSRWLSPAPRAVSACFVRSPFESMWIVDYDLPQRLLGSPCAPLLRAAPQEARCRSTRTAAGRARAAAEDGVVGHRDRERVVLVGVLRKEVGLVPAAFDVGRVAVVVAFAKRWPICQASELPPALCAPWLFHVIHGSNVDSNGRAAPPSTCTRSPPAHSTDAAVADLRTFTAILKDIVSAYREMPPCPPRWFCSV